MSEVCIQAVIFFIAFLVKCINIKKIPGSAGDLTMILNFNLSKK